MSRLSRGGRALFVAAAVVVLVAPVSAYVPLTLSFSDGEPLIARWSASSFPVVFIGSEGLSDDLPVDDQVDAIEDAMGAWSDVATSTARMRYGGEGAAQAGLLDGINAIEFSDDPVLDFDSLVARTFLFTDVDGTILEADILVNNRRFQFNTDGGDIGLDLQTVLTKELGHALGLDNSPVGLTSGGFGSVEVDETSAVMFAIARGPGQTARVLTDDDIAGVSAMYPDGTSLGGISGRVTGEAGLGVFGAHVVVFDPIDQLLVGTLTLPDGSYSIQGLPPGRYVMRVQPPATNGLDLDDFGGIYAIADTGAGFTFLPVFLDRAIDVTAGVTVDGVDLEVS